MMDLDYKVRFPALSLSSLHIWQEIILHYCLEQQHQRQLAPDKNATDIVLVVDAMDILYKGIFRSI